MDKYRTIRVVCQGGRLLSGYHEIMCPTSRIESKRILYKALSAHLLSNAHSYIHASETRLFFPFEPYRIVIGDVCSILKADTFNANLAGCGIFIKEHIIIVIC